MDNKKILIVDDNEFFIQQEIFYLDRRRFDIHTARSGQEALEKARSLLPDLILLDQIMADMTGQEVCRILKKDSLTGNIPIIIVSSGEKEPSRNDTTQTGCDGLIFKPIRKDLLVTMVEEFLGIKTRQWQRASVDLSCSILSEDGEISTTIHSLSAEGVFVEMAYPPIPGEVFGVLFTIPEGGRQVLARSAAVVWSGRVSENGPDGAGVRFLTIDPSDRDYIDEYVNTLLKKERSEIDQQVES
jgi:CheY-like chemotaxis protein